VAEAEGDAEAEALLEALGKLLTELVALPVSLAEADGALLPVAIPDLIGAQLVKASDGEAPDGEVPDSNATQPADDGDVLW
jgi:hypothetical protein